MSANPKIVVTGANGQLGKELQDLCSSFSKYEFVFLAKDDLPIHHFELVRNYFRTLSPAYCINCAAYTNVDKAEEEKDLAFQVNGEAVGVLAAICREHSTQLFHISSDYVFDGKATTPYREDAITHPINSYGASKLEGEVQALNMNPDTTIIRSSWIYSAYGKNFVKTMMRLMAERSEITVVNDQIGSPTYAADLAELIMQMLTTGKKYPGIYHYSNDGVISWFEFATAIKELVDYKCVVKPIPSSEYPTLAARPSFSVLDKSKIQETLGIRLKDWKKSLEACIRKVEANKASTT